MKICFLEPPLPFSKPEYISYPGTPYLFPSIGMGYTASVLEEAGYQVDILECPGQDINLKELYAIVEREQYDIIGLSTWYFDYAVALVSLPRMLNAIKRRSPSTYIAAGGFLATLNYDLLLENIEQIDCCVIGETEVTFLEFVKTLENGGDLRKVNGLAFRDGEQIIKTDIRQYIPDLDVLPIPKRVFVNDEIKSVGLVTTRGCYGTCVFCVDNEVWRKNNCFAPRQRSVASVMEEIKYLKENFEFEKIYIYDTNFLAASKKRKIWLEEFYQQMKANNFFFPFRIETRANDVIGNAELMKKMCEVGLWRIFIGIESFLQRQLDFFDKKTTVAQNIEALEICRDLGLMPEYGFLVLEPFVTLDEVLESVKIMKDLKIHEFSYPCQELLSISSRRLVAPPGVKANDTVQEASTAAENYFGYDFVNSDVDLYFNITKVWEKRVKNYFPYYYLFNHVGDEQSDLAKKIIEGNAQMKRLDIDIVEILCQKIKNNEIRQLEDAMGLLDEWEKEMQQIFAPYQEFKKIIYGN